MITFANTVVDPATQQVAANIAKLPFDEYPEFCSQLDELDWLSKLIGD